MQNKNQKQWDNIYAIQSVNHSYNKYPTEHIVVFVAKNYFARKDRSSVRILEIGCGSGSNLIFLAKEGFKTFGIDFSPNAIEISLERLQECSLAADLKATCVTSLPWKSNFFDACVESNTIHCNTTDDIKRIIDEIYRVLKPGGLFYGIMVSDKSDEFGKGDQLDSRTFDFSDTKTFRGQFDSFPILHFFGKEELVSLTQRFSSIQLELDLSTYESGQNPSPLGYWLVQLKK